MAKLIVNSIEIPLTEEPDINLSPLLSFLSKETGGYVTTTLTVVPTKEAMQALGQTELFNRVNPVTRYDATLITKSGAVAGKVEVVEVRFLQAQGVTLPEAIECNFVFDAAPWLTAMSGKRWRDVIGLTATDWTEANVLTMADADPDSNPDVGVALIDWDDQGLTAPITHTRFTPLIFVRQLLKEAFAEEGYDLTGPFIDSRIAKRLVVPVRWGQYGQEWRLANTDVILWRSFQQSFNRTSAASGWGKVSFLSAIEGAGQNYTASPSYRYTCPHNGHYLVSGIGYYTLDGVSGVFVTPLEIRKNGVAVTDFGAGILQYEGECQAGDTFEWYIWCEGGFVTRVQPESRGVVVFSPVNPDTGQPIDGAPLVPNQLAPEDWMLGDLIHDLTDAFNLMWRTVDDTTVEVWPADTVTFFPWDGGAQEEIPGLLDEPAKDIDNLVGQVEHITYPDDWSQALILRWASEGALVEQIDGEAELKGGDGKLFIHGTDSRYAAKEKVVALRKLAKTMGKVAADIRHETSPFAPVVPLIEEGELPHLLLFEGRRAGRDGYVQVAWTPDPYDLPACFFFNWADQNGADLSLMFGEETATTGYQVAGLGALFHIHLAARIKTWRHVSVIAAHDPTVRPGDVVRAMGTLWIVHSITNIKGGFCRILLINFDKAAREGTYVEGGAPRLIKED